MIIMGSSNSKVTIILLGTGIRDPDATDKLATVQKYVEKIKAHSDAKVLVVEPSAFNRSMLGTTNRLHAFFARNGDHISDFIPAVIKDVARLGPFEMYESVTFDFLDVHDMTDSEAREAFEKQAASFLGNRAVAYDQRFQAARRRRKRRTGVFSSTHTKHGSLYPKNAKRHSM